jgi:hypothetical protein
VKCNHKSTTQLLLFLQNVTTTHNQPWAYNIFKLSYFLHIQLFIVPGRDINYTKPIISFIFVLRIQTVCVCLCVSTITACKLQRWEGQSTAGWQFHSNSAFPCAQFFSVNPLSHTTRKPHQSTPPAS